MAFAYFPVFSFLAALLVIVPMPWHWKARNVPTLTIMGWLFVLNIIYGINSVIWRGNVLYTVPVWCDITTKLIVGGQQALPAAILCLCRSLESIAAGRMVTIDRRTRQRWMIFDLCMCVGVPVILMALHYVVQGHRFDIIEDLGCRPSIYISLPSVFILWLPPLVLVTAALGFATAAFWHFLRFRIQFHDTLKNANVGMTPERYFRLMGMAIVVILWNTILNIIDLAGNVVAGLRPYTSWADVHSNFDRADAYPLVLIPSYTLRLLILVWWAIPISAFLVFLFFGSGEQATTEYCKVFKWFKRLILRRKSTDTGRQTLPHHSTASKRKAHPTSVSTYATELTKFPSSPVTPSALPAYYTLSSATLASSTPTSIYKQDKSLPSTPAHSDFFSASSPTDVDHLSIASHSEAHILPTPVSQSARPYSFPTLLYSPTSPRDGRRESRRFSFFNVRLFPSSP